MSLVLDGLSTAHEPSLGLGAKWCITVTPLNDDDKQPKAQGGAGRYTNSTRLMACDGGAAQKFVMDQFSRLTYAMPGGETGCLDCSNCQGGPSQTKMKLYTPCFGGASPSPNERFIYNKAAETLVTPFNGKCVGVCADA